MVMLSHTSVGMTDWFTDEEMERIVRFAKSAGHDRDPGMLLPEDADDGEASSTTESEGVGGAHGGETVVSEE